MADNGSAVGTGLIAGILIVIVIGIGILFATGGLDGFRGSKDVDVNIEAPRVPTPAPGG